ncbi:MAG: enoyl-CoA hydratase/isomerase family protein, partial [Oscillospiraceae bacterium]
MYDNYTQIAVSLENRVATLAFNREKELNSFSASLKTECTDALNRLSEDSAVGVVVITGRGRHFCAGGTIPELKSY